MRAVILAGGAMGDYGYFRQFITPDDYIIAADSGYSHAEALGLRPHVLLGDFDSLDVIPDGIDIHRVPAEKNFTDMELAVEWGRERGVKEFLFLGAIGTRMDHTLTNIFLLARLLDAGEAGEIIDEHNRIWITDSGVEVEAGAGDILSLIPISTCRGVATRNLAYPLHEATLAVGYGLGVSNVVEASPAGVTLSAGRLLVMLCRD